jgi:Lon protease-like protein
VDSQQPDSYPDQIDLMILPWVSLFPGSLLPLYIFEERYREMTRAALAGNRMFAIAHTYDDSHVAPIGGLGIIRACVANDGRNIQPHPSGRLACAIWNRETSATAQCKNPNLA